MGEFTSKWAAGIQDEERCKALRSCIAAIQVEARKKGYNANYFEMSRIIRGLGVNISDTYVYSHFAGIASRYPFPFEVLVLLCRGYNIPLSVVFSEQVTKGLK